MTYRSNKFKYVAWHNKNEHFYRGWKLLNEVQANTIISSLVLTCPKCQETYVTVQDFDKDGNAIGCPIYADFDGVSAIKDIRDFARTIEKISGSFPQLYFSGHKGFHAIVPYYVKGKNCHQVAGHIVRQLQGAKNWFSLDLKVYTDRRLLRYVNTYNLGGKRFKIPITPTELFTLELSDIAEFAREPGKQFMYGESLSDEGIKKLDLLSTKAVEEVDRVTKSKRTRNCIKKCSWLAEVTPCLRHMIENMPDDGSCNATIVILSRFFKSCGVDLDEAIDILMDQDHYYAREQKEKDVIKVVKSIYRSPKVSGVGCKYSPNKEIMTKYCDPLCKFSKEEVWF